MLDAELKSKINLLWDKFWSSGVSNPLQAIEQISYLIFLKRLEDEDTLRNREADKLNLQIRSLFEDKKELRWSVWTNYDSSTMLSHVRDKVFPFMRKLGGKDSIYNRYMSNAVFSIPSGSLLTEAVRIINDMHIKEQNKDTKGDIYEYLLSELSISGKNGQFRTPRHIINMMVQLIDPKFGESICDPACGTSGFLISAYKHILRSNTSSQLIKIDNQGNEYNFRGDKLTKPQREILDKSIHGFEIDQTMTRISLMNLMMHGIRNPTINHSNSLSKRFDQTGYYDVILANPPFKGSIDQSEISDEIITKTKKTELLFLELMFNILTKNGRCAVIVPDGVLFGGSSAHKDIKRMIVERCKLEAVISMPSGIFKPYAGVSTGILIFTKGQKTDKVMFYDMESDGYALDDKRKFIDGKGDIPDIISKFRNRKKTNNSDRKSKCFEVPVSEIIDNDFDLSLSKYKEIEYEAKEYEKPDVIKRKIIVNEKKILELIDGLKF